MATIKTKYSLGDVVYNASCYRDSYFEECPDCDGTGKWKVEGKDLQIECKTCNQHYWQRDSAGKVQKYKYFPNVSRLTIGQIRATVGNNPEIRYMCKETGLGSGTLWYESSLLRDKDMAEEFSKILAEKKNAGEEISLEDLLAATAMQREPDITQPVAVPEIIKAVADFVGSQKGGPYTPAVMKAAIMGRLEYGDAFTEMFTSLQPAPDISRLVEALELISDTDPDDRPGTEWFHEIANTALAAYRKQGDET